MGMRGRIKAGGALASLAQEDSQRLQTNEKTLGTACGSQSLGTGGIFTNEVSKGLFNLD